MDGVGKAANKIVFTLTLLLFSLNIIYEYVNDTPTEHHTENQE